MLRSLLIFIILTSSFGQQSLASTCDEVLAAFIKKIVKSYRLKVIDNNTLTMFPDQVPPSLLDANQLYSSQLSYAPLTPINNRVIRDSEKLLQDGEIESFTFPYSGASLQTSPFLKLNNGIKGIWKAHRETSLSNYRADVLAYELDQIFEINLVPETIVRIVNGVTGSFQIFKKSITDKSPLQSELNKQSFFDFLINNGDRHYGNFLVDENAKISSIDNSSSFTIQSKLNALRTFSHRQQEIDHFLNTKEATKVLININNQLDSKYFKQQVIKYIGTEDTNNLLGRMEFIINYDRLKKTEKDPEKLLSSLQDLSPDDPTTALFVSQSIQKTKTPLKNSEIMLAKVTKYHKSNIIINGVLEALKYNKFQIHNSFEIIRNFLELRSLNEETLINLTSTLPLLKITNSNRFNLIKKLLETSPSDNILYRLIYILKELKLDPMEKKIIFKSILVSKSTHDIVLKELLSLLKGRESSYIHGSDLIASIFDKASNKNFIGLTLIEALAHSHHPIEGTSDFVKDFVLRDLSVHENDKLSKILYLSAPHFKDTRIWLKNYLNNQ